MLLDAGSGVDGAHVLPQVGPVLPDKFAEDTWVLKVVVVRLVGAKVPVTRLFKKEMTKV